MSANPTAPAAEDFERLVAPHRATLLAHCYRMLGSAHDAEDAVQEALLRAWRGLPAFAGRSSLRTWLLRIATNVCLRALERRPRRVLPAAAGPAADPHAAPAAPLAERVWLEPLPDDVVAAEDGPPALYERREAVELAFVAALQHLPPRQRAVLLLRDVLGFAPAEIAVLLGTSAAAVSSALQRAHLAVDALLPARSQQVTLRALGDDALRETVARYVAAWEAADVPALVALLADDVTFAMPPSPSWYRGRADVGAFLARRPLARPGRWRVLPARANGQLAFAYYLVADDPSCGWVAHSLDVCTLDATGAITALVAFHELRELGRFGLPATLD